MQRWTKTVQSENSTHMFKAVHALDAWLWRRGFYNPLVRFMLKVQILFFLFVCFLGLIALPWTAHGLTFAVGAAIFANIFWGISGQILGLSLTKFSGGLLFLLLIRTGLRLALAAAVLYVAFVVFKASALAIVCGVTASMGLALGTFAYNHFSKHKQ